MNTQGEQKSAEEQIADLKVQLNAVYQERDLVLALAVAFALESGYPVWYKEHEGGKWDDDWRNVIIIDLPECGQVSWHIHKDELINFPYIYPYDGKWDGHSTEEKYRRVKKFVQPRVRHAD